MQQPRASAPSKVERPCVACDDTFTVSVRSRREKCDDCARTHTCLDCLATFQVATFASNVKRCPSCRQEKARERARVGMRLVRQRNGRFRDAEGKEPFRLEDGNRSKGLRTATLFCGHDLLFYIAPEKGDTVWCERCDDYSEYLGKNPRCSAGKHVMTRWNVTVSSSGRKYCQSCIYDTDDTDDTTDDTTDSLAVAA